MNESELTKRFAKNIRMRRILAGITQKELAQRAHIAVGSVSAYESGNKHPTAVTAYKIAEVYNVSVGDLFLPIEIVIGGKEL